MNDKLRYKLYKLIRLLKNNDYNILNYTHSVFIVNYNCNN